MVFASGIPIIHLLSSSSMQGIHGIGIGLGFYGLVLELLYTVWEHRQHWSCLLFSFSFCFSLG
jgi:hypothetical protein